VDGGIAGDVRDDSGVRITRSLRCPLVQYFEILAGCDNDNTNNNERRTRYGDILKTLSNDNPLLRSGKTVIRIQS
jgi:hypothetical protein